MQAKITISIFLGLILTAFFATGCGQAPKETPAIIPTETPLPTPTAIPTQELSPLAILVLPTNMDPDLSNQYQKIVYDLTQQTGMRFQLRNTLTEADLESSLKVVIALPPDFGIMTLAAAAPQTQFLAVNIPDIAAGGNVSVVAQNNRPDLIAFLAGYIGAMIIEDYHIGMLYPDGSPDAKNEFTAFQNGMVYYCGICNPWAGPFYDYPIPQAIPPEASPDQYGAYVNVLKVQSTVEYIYVHPDITSPELLEALSVNGAYFITTVTPERPLPGMVASIQPDIIQAIYSAWPNLLAGNGGLNVESPPQITNVDPNLLSPGRQLQAEEVLLKLLEGSIFTGIQ
ncbi:MAG: hypothetical protein JXA13_08555 [Anaerolineales bacterium]|nr:hypothetical protein [Anaerolineales bacterium]